MIRTSHLRMAGKEKVAERAWCLGIRMICWSRTTWTSQALFPCRALRLSPARFHRRRFEIVGWDLSPLWLAAINWSSRWFRFSVIFAFHFCACFGSNLLHLCNLFVLSWIFTTIRLILVFWAMEFWVIVCLCFTFSLKFWLVISCTYWNPLVELEVLRLFFLNFEIWFEARSVLIALFFAWVCLNSFTFEFGDLNPLLNWIVTKMISLVPVWLHHSIIQSAISDWIRCSLSSNFTLAPVRASLFN